MKATRGMSRFSPRWSCPAMADLRLPAASVRAIVASVAMAAALAVLLHDQVRHPYSVADYGDPLFSIWRIGWVNHQLLADPRHILDGNIFYPETRTLTRSDPMILVALTGAPLAALGLHPVVVYNVLLFAGFWLSGIATYVLVERLTGSARAAFIAGLMFACYSYRFDHYSHLELLTTYWLPVGLLALHSFVATSRWRFALALAGAAIAQLYSSLYYAIFFLVYASVIGAGLAAVHRPNLRRLSLRAAGAGALAVAMALPLILPFRAVQPFRGDRPRSEIEFFSARPSDYLRANKYSVMWRDRMLPPVPERALFPGVAPIVLGVIALVPPLGAMPVIYAAGGLAAFDASRGFGGFLYPFLHRWLPGVQGLRAPARFSILVGLTLSILAGFGALRILRYCKPPALGWAVTGLLAAAILVDAWPALQLVPVWKEPPPLYELLPSDRDVILAELPVVHDPAFNTPYMYFSLWHWRPMINGYSGQIPRSYEVLVEDLVRFPRREPVATLRQRGVTHVMLNCGLDYVVQCEDISTQMRLSKDLHLVQASTFQGRTIELYELLR
jgi:hypothetical protein